MSAKKNKEIVEYIFTQICDISVETIKKLGTTLTLWQIIAADDEYWANMVERKVLSGLDVQMIKTFNQWYLIKYNEGTYFPTELEEWKELITAQIMDKFTFDLLSKAQ